MKEYNPGRLDWFIADIVLATVSVTGQPISYDQEEEIKKVFTNLNLIVKDETRCPNCDASMAQYNYSFDALDALLLFAIAKRSKETKNEAVHVPSLTVSHAIKCRTTKAQYFGFIQKHRIKGKHAGGMWKLTHKGEEAIANQQVTASITVWRDEVIDWSGETTVGAVFAEYRKKIQDRKDRGIMSRDDYSQYVDDALKWYSVAGYQQGKLI